MTKKQILNRIRRMCSTCPLKCPRTPGCPLLELKDGIDSTKVKREMPEKVLLNLKGYQKKIAVKDEEESV